MLDLEQSDANMKQEIDDGAVISETTLHAKLFHQERVKTELPFDFREEKDHRLGTTSSKNVLPKRKVQKQHTEFLASEDAVELTHYKCEKCGESFKRMSLLKSHDKCMHSISDDYGRSNNGEKPKKLVVTKCLRSLRLSSDSDSKSEMDILDENSNLTLIDVDSAIPSDLNTLYESLTKLKNTPIGKTVYKCRMCKKITLQLRQHLMHIIAHSGQSCNACTVCDDVFMGSKTLDDHMLRVHNNDRDDYLLCGIVKCKECPERFVSTTEFKFHKLWHEGKQSSHNCNTCQRLFSSKAVLENHKRVIHNQSKNLPKRFECFLCKERFPFQILLTNHKRSHPEFFELIERTTILKRYDNSKKILYACRTCGKSTHSQTNHLDHLNTHSTERHMYKCTLCPKQFTSKSTLKAHLRLHTNENPYKCKICAIVFRHRKTLRNHLNKHSGKVVAMCKYCKKTFRDQNQSTEHVRRMHTGETAYQCDLCREWFTTAAQLRSHKLNTHNGDSRKK